MMILGYIGGALLACCGVPQIIKALKTRSMNDLSLFFLLMWLFGEIFLGIHVLYEAFTWPLFLNYVINTIICVILVAMKLIWRNSSL